MPLIAGVDCSTQATKVLVVDADDGTVVAEGRAPHEVEGTGGARETHPRVWWEALGAALGQTHLARRVAAISVAGQQHGLVVSDRHGPLRPAPLWNDTRSSQDAQHLSTELGGPVWWAERVGVVPVASFTVTKWAWLKRSEPAIADRTIAVRLPHDWLTEQLTGEGVTDRGDASGTGWWSNHSEGYVTEVLKAVGLPAELLPEVRRPEASAGELVPSAADFLDLTAGIPVGVGTGDNMAAALGLAVGPGVPVISLGTSGTAYALSTRPAADPSGVVAGFADATGRFLPLACTLNCTLAVDRVASWLGLDREAAAQSTDVVVLPYLDGERTPNLPDATGSIMGLRHGTQPGEILLAAYQGAVASLMEALEAIDRHGSGLDPDAPLVLIGGGAQGATWRRVVASLSGRAVQVPILEEPVALGAAVQAAAVLTGSHPAKIAQQWDAAGGEVVEPRERDRAALERIRRARQHL